LPEKLENEEMLEGPVEKLMWVALAYLNSTGGRLPSNAAVLQGAVCHLDNRNNKLKRRNHD